MAALALGPLSVVALAAGLGLSVPHAQAGAWWPLGVAGALLTAAGLAGLVACCAVLWRRWRWYGRVLTPVGVLVLLYAVGYPVGLAVAVVTTPRPPVAAGAAGALGPDVEEVTATTSDGVRLAGWYVPSRNGSAVVVVPGASSSRSAAAPQAAVLVRHGYGVLLLDPRGTGRSGGRVMNLGWAGDRDVAAALDVVLARPDVTGRVGVLGESMGGEIAIGAAGADPRVAAVVAEGATVRVAADKAWLSDVYGVRGTLTEAVERVVTACVGALADVPAPPPLVRSAAQAAPRPLLLVAAGTVPDEAHAAASVAAAGPHVTTWVVPGATHTGGLRAQPDAWERRVVAFLDAALLPAAGVSG